MNAKVCWVISFVAFATGVAGCDRGGGADAGPAVDGQVPTTECSGDLALCGNACVNTDTNASHCGACDNACGVGEACSDGACELVCPAGQTICDGACVDTDTDRAHCGGCGAACGAGERCAGGSCELSCPAGQEVCGGACVNTNTDPANCGGCGTTCEAGQVCDTGACATSCSAGLTECSGACVDVDHDPGHCGGCDAACAAGANESPVCIAGGCRSVCDTLYQDCNGDLEATEGDGCETPVATDVNNCGACGRACVLDDAIAGCVAGACTIAACAPGFGDCDGSVTNGCERDVTSDALNCGACGTVCSGTDSCIEAVCRPTWGEDCSAPVILADGSNTIYWTATAADYITSSPSCLSSTYAPTGPDVVLSYTATVAGEHSFSLATPTTGSDRYVMLLSAGACGTLTPERDCHHLTSTVVNETFLSAGQTVYLYIIDTDDEPEPLENPLTVSVSPPSCTAPTMPAVDQLTPGVGATASSLAPVLEISFDAPISRYVGVITLTGDRGTSVSYDLSTSPSNVVIDAAGDDMTIDPTDPFASGETITVTWSGIVGLECATPVTLPSWLFHMVDCSTNPPPSVTAVTPANGTTTTTLSPTFQVTLDAAVLTDTGTITITGDMGTSLTYDLATAPPEVSFSSGNTVVTIVPGSAFVGLETLTVDVSGLRGAICAQSVTTTPWSVTLPCAELDSDPMNCGTCGNVCPASDPMCVGGTCGIQGSGESCASPWFLELGVNTVAWTAANAEYLTFQPTSCEVPDYADPVGPDLVLAFPVSTTGTYDIDFDKPTSTRWMAVVSSQTCGTLEPRLTCISDWAPATMGGSFTATAGETVYVYVRATDSGTMPIDNPLTVTLALTP